MREDILQFERNRSTFTDKIFDNETNVNYVKMIIGLIRKFSLWGHILGKACLR